MESLCPWCREAFAPASARQRFCRRACQQNFNRDRAGKPECSAQGCARPARAKGLCNSHYKAQHPNRQSWKKNGDPEVRRANLRRKTQQRRARTKGDLDAELIDRNEIGERDLWRCGLCRKSIARDLPYPHPESASLDHIEPLSLGGRHVRSNVQIAHLACNIAKGNRVTDVQPLLVG